jgi:hypothetical protein
MAIIRRFLSICSWLIASLFFLVTLFSLLESQIASSLISLAISALFILVAKKTWPNIKIKPHKPPKTPKDSALDVQDSHVSAPPVTAQFETAAKPIQTDNSDLVGFEINEQSQGNNLSIQITTQSSHQPSTANSEKSLFDNFKISGKHNKAKSTATWIMPKEHLKVGSHEIQGMVYTGANLFSLNGYEVESSLLDLSLPWMESSSNYQDHTLNYWPSFSSLSEQCRGAYISWLASPRNDPQTPLGYVFLYFYGLERRLLIDQPKGGVSDEEQELLLLEIKRLVAVYSNSRSFTSYAQNLLDYVGITSPSCNIESNHIDFSKHSFQFKIKLAETVKAGASIPAEVALNWVLGLPDYQQKTASKRCQTEFRELFKARYLEEYGQGLIVKPNKTKLKIDYRPASGSLRGFQPIELDLPDPTALKAPIKNLVTLADSCNAELDPYSRYIGQANNSSSNFEAQLLLPKIISNQLENSILGDLKGWMCIAITEQAGCIAIPDLWGKIGKKPPEKINKKEIDLITQTIEAVGFSFAPDPRYHRAKPTPDGIIVIRPAATSDSFNPSQEFHELTTTLKLGSTVACIDKTIKPGEAEYLSSLINRNSLLTEEEKASLHGYLTWLLHSPIQTLGIKAALSKLSSKQKNTVGNILVEVALSDGSIIPEEIKQLEKLYTALGLDKTRVTSDIHRSSSTDNSLSEQRSNEYSPDPHNLVFNEERLKKLDQETKEVSAFIGSIFSEEDELVEEEQREGEDNTGSIQEEASESNLDSIFLPIYKTLLSKDSWSRSDVDDLCKKHNLMTDGAIEAINDWSFTVLDAAIFEDEGDTILVDQEIKEELIELETHS